jgi:hypothetical protein
MFIQTTQEAEAEGRLREIYDGDRKSLGYVPNHAKVFSLRPEVLEAWRAFQGSMMMEFSQKIVRTANEMTQADVDALRALGLEDIEILDITLVATMRCFASKTFDALGAGPDPVYNELEHQLSDLLPA